MNFPVLIFTSSCGKTTGASSTAAELSLSLSAWTAARPLSKRNMNTVGPLWIRFQPAHLAIMRPVDYGPRIPEIMVSTIFGKLYTSLVFDVLCQRFRCHPEHIFGVPGTLSKAWDSNTRRMAGYGTRRAITHPNRPNDYEFKLRSPTDPTVNYVVNKKLMVIMASINRLP